MENEVKTFEERLARLNEIVSKVEGETLPLEETMALYEEGKALITGLEKELKESEEKVKKLRELETQM